MNEILPGEQADFLNVRIVDAQDGLVTAKLDGELSHATCAPVLELLIDAINRGETRIVLDLRDVGFCDSAGLGLFVQLNKRTTGEGGWLRLAAPTPFMANLLAITNLDRALPVFDSVSQARGFTRGTDG
jgi:anti-anti-sigma factor